MSIMNGIVELYCETKDGTFQRLDMFDDENITLNYLYKDTLDISKIYSTYSLNFSIPASDKNKSIFNFIFKPELQSSKSRFINGKIYINKMLFKIGKFEVQTGKFINAVLNTYNLNFSTGVASLKTIIGDDLLSSLSANTSTNIDWNTSTIYSGLTSTQNPDVLVPLISNKRIWTYEDGGPNDIKYNGASVIAKKGVDINELRPAVKFSTIMDEIFDKYNLSVVSPLFNTPDYEKLYVWCNRGTILGSINNFRTLTLDLPFGAYRTSNSPPLPHAYDISYTFSSTTFTLFRNPANTGALYENPSFGIYIENLLPVFPNGQEVYAEAQILDLRPNHFEEVLYNEKVPCLRPDGTYIASLRWYIPGSIWNTINVANPLPFKVQMKFTEPVYWTTGCTVDMNASTPIIFAPPNAYSYQKFSRFNSSSGITPSTTAINGIGSIPDIKIIDLLTSFFNMFSIRVIESNIISTSNGFEYPPMEWIPSSAFITNIEKDYTPNIDITNYDVEVPTKYKSYVFQHKQPKYRSSVDWEKANVGQINSKQYGQLIYDTGNKNLTEEYKLETQVSIIPPVIISGTAIQTYYGFTDEDKEDSSIYPDGAYKPNFEDVTLFYFDELTFPKLIDGSDINIGFISGSTTVPISQYVNFNIATSSDENDYTNSLGFKDEVNLLPEQFICLKNLYSKYYDPLIRTITNESLYYFNFVGWLTASQILDFNLRDIIIIGNERYVIEAATINIVTGYSTFKLLNVPTTFSASTVNYVYNPTHYDNTQYETIQ